MNKKVILLVAIFLLLVPFRLPIGVLFIKLITNIATMTGGLTDEILAANVIVTKIIYDIALGAITVYNLEILSRKIKGRKPKQYGDETDVYWWTGVIIAMLVIYTIFDAINTNDLYYSIR